MLKNKLKKEKTIRRQKRSRAKIRGKSDYPRLTVFKSNKYVYAQIIDDEQGQTLVSASSLKKGMNGLTDKAKEVGKDLAEKAQAKKIEKIVFDKSGYLYTGIIRALAEGARAGGLKF